jgi:predicted dinucleotide-binding enzyme
MRIGVLGTGIVGQTLATRLVGLGHEVRMGAREAGNERARGWAAERGDRASEGSFGDAARFGELVVNCTNGEHSLAALDAAGADALAGKVLVDVANVLDFSQGAPPVVGVALDDSLGERIQRAHPEARVVKSLHTMNCAVMVDPASVPGPHAVFVCGDDEAAKADVAELLQQFGWPAERVVDLGGLDGARATELYVALWLRLYGALGSPAFNIAVHSAG